MDGQPFCNACESPNREVVATLLSEIDGKEYHALKCMTCGLISASPIPDLSFRTLQDVYGIDYTEDERECRNDHALQALRTATARQMEIVEQFVSNGVALNVGSMNGAMTVLEERGWRVRFVEVSSYAAETARELWGFDVTISRIEDFEGPPASFDFIKLGHVIEHLADPRIAFERLATLLRPGGIILVDTDNAEGLNAQVEFATRRLLGEKLAADLVRKLTGKNLRKRYGRLIPPVHLHCFSELSLTRLLRSTGFEVLRVFKPAWGDSTWFPLADRSGFSTVERIFLRLDQLGARLGRGNAIAVLARKR